VPCVFAVPARGLSQPTWPPGPWPLQVYAAFVVPLVAFGLPLLGLRRSRAKVRVCAPRHCGVLAQRLVRSSAGAAGCLSQVAAGFSHPFFALLLESLCCLLFLWWRSPQAPPASQ
jgi:hypothetical protein